MSGLADTDRQREVLDRYRSGLHTGAVFGRAAIGHRSRFGYEPPINRRDWSRAVRVLAEMGADGDQYAQVAQRCVGRINLYGVASEAAGAIYEAASMAVHDGYTDVIGRAAPDAAGPPSHFERAFSLHECTAIAVWLHAAVRPFDHGGCGIGWALQAVCEEEGIDHQRILERAAS